MMLTVVRDPDEMSEEHFLLHLQKRHPESFPPEAGPIDHFVSEYVEECYRTFHDKLHEIRVDIDHEHEE